jgi:enamine deaminase RidA (YjgF/YER057c/UK114 family)
MAKEHLTAGRETSRAYSRAVKSRGGTTVYLCGVGGSDDADGRSLAGDFAAQTRRVFERMSEIMAEAGGSLDDVVTMTVFITDSRYGDEFIELRKGYFQRGYPASALIGVESLARPQMLVEVQGVAVIDD